MEEASQVNVLSETETSFNDAPEPQLKHKSVVTELIYPQHRAISFISVHSLHVFTENIVHN